MKIDDMKSRIFVALLLSVALLIPCYGVVIGNFDSLDKLIDRADAIAVVRIDSHINNQSNPSLYTTHRCYVYQTLKGEVPVGKTIPLRLIDTTGSFREKFRLLSTHLVFFVKEPKDKDGIEYRSLQWQGANIEVSPFGNEKLPEGKSIKETIKLLIQRYVEYRNEEQKKEDALLQKVVKS